MTDLPNHHDRFFKEVFSRPDAAEGFALNFLPTNVSGALAPNSFQLQKGSFVDQQLREYFSDLVYKVEFRNSTEGFLYILFEHKSYPDPDVAFQLLRYMTRIWDKTTVDPGSDLLPVIPVVLYHGAAKWRVSPNFSALYKVPESVRPDLLDFTYHLCDLSAYSDEEIKTRALFSATLGVALLLMKNFFSPDLSKRLAGYFELVRTMSEQTALAFLETVLRYLGCAGEKVSSEDLSRAIQDALGEEGEIYMESLLDKWLNQGKEQGLQQGLQRGKHAGVASLTIRQLTRRFGKMDEATEERVRQLPLEALERLGEDLLDFTEGSSVKEWLDRIGTAH